MRILLDPGTPDLRNVGNNAMLQVMVCRLHRMWPRALIEVITTSPHLLKLYCPEAYPRSKDGRRDRFERPKQIDLFHRFVPKLVWRLLFEMREEVWRRWPSLTPYQIRKNLRPWLQWKIGDPQQWESIPGSENEGDIDDGPLQNLLNDVDILIVVGGGAISDPIKDVAIPVLDRLEIAARLGKVTAMLGQGIGPINDSELRAKARTVLPLVDLIAVREEHLSAQLLNSLDVNLSRVFFTGDDAVEMAYEARTKISGNGIGVSMRVSTYSEVEERHIESVREVLQQLVVKHGARLIALPISHGSHEWDGRVIQRLLSDQASSKIPWPWQRFNTPLEIIKRVGNCRIVVTGTYHAAVFALAQGIPAIGLARSGHYTYKFMGLSDQFSPGFKLIRLDDDHMQEKLIEAIENAWELAEQVKPKLLQVAEKQIASGNATYHRIDDLFSSRNQRIC